MKYLRTFNENMSLAKSIISKKMDGFEKLKTLLKSNLGLNQRNDKVPQRSYK